MDDFLMSQPIRGQGGHREFLIAPEKKTQAVVILFPVEFR